MVAFTVCILGFGDHVQQLRRCIDALLCSDYEPYVSSIRIGLNEPSPRMLACIAGYVRGGILRDTDVYVSPINAGKYPVMRAMFRDARNPIDTDFIMWFDDDSFLRNDVPGWWATLSVYAETADLIGEPWYMGLTAKQRAWLRTRDWGQAWLNSAGVSKVKFCQGAWWCLRTTRMREADWPIPELHHKGGDVLLGVVAAGCGWRVHWYRNGVAINADDRGVNSAAVTRGLKPPAIGSNFNGTALPAAVLPVFVPFESKNHV